MSIRIFNTLLIITAAVTIGLTSSFIASASVRSLPPDTPHHSSSAPGYCSSYGGSHLYEYIQGVSYSLKPGGTISITVYIYIANPTGCVAGEPCPEYDNSPEYINAWIDWDGDKVFESNEKILDADLTGYLGINYQGTMSTSTIITIPADAVSFTWMRVTLGWGHDPNNPCERDWTWGDIVDKEVMVRPEIEIRGGLIQYKDELKDIVFRRKDDKPRFEVKAILQDGEELKVDIFRKGNMPIKTLDTVKKSEKIYEAIWNDWTSSEWVDIPDEIPVGKYRAKAKIIRSGSELTGSEKKEFYVIFNTPESLGNTEKKAYLYDDSGIRDEIGVWFAPKEYSKGILWWKKWYSKDRGIRYKLAPFNYKVFKNAINQIDGETSPQKATKKLSEYVSNSFEYALSPYGYNPNTGEYEVLYLLNQTKAQCADMANLLTAYLRSVGIPSHPTAIDANPNSMKAVGDNWWYFHTWTEAYINGEWKVTDPHDHLLGFNPVSRKTHGTSGKWAYIKKVNDIVLVASPNFNNGELNDNLADVVFKYNPSDTKNYKDGVSVPETPPLEHQKSWVKDISFDYWNKNSFDPRDLSDPPSGYSLSISTDKSTYKVGDSVEINVVIKNDENVPYNLTLDLNVIDVVDPNAAFPEVVVLYSYSKNVNVPANTELAITHHFNLPQELDTTDEFYIKASYGDEIDWTFFDVIPSFEVTTLLPDNMIQGEEYSFNLSITNTGDETLRGINVTLLASKKMIELLDAPSYYVGDLRSGEKANITWNVRAAGASLGGVTFKVESENGGTDYVSDYIKVLTSPELDIEEEYISFSGEIGKPFGISFKVRNVGDLTANNVSVEISLPNNVTATNSTWNIDNLAGGEEVTLSTNITFTGNEDFVIDVFASDDAGHTASGIVWVDVITAFLGEFNDVYSDYGVDINNDGLYDNLIVEVGINVTTPGNFRLEGWLYDANGIKILQTENSTYLNVGDQIVTLNFDGFTIYKHGVDGPYYLRYLNLYDETGALIDSRDYADTTSPYNFTDFQHLVFLTGNYWDYGTDIDDDGIFDYLTVHVEVILTNPGYCVIKGRLMDTNEQEIVWAENTAYLEADQPQIIQLNFDGETIYNHGVDGPYYLRDVYIYHTGDPAQPDYVYEAYTTNAYRSLQFGVILGDLDTDGDVDRDDLNILLTYRNQPASACPECDIDGDGVITVLDARKLVLMCTRSRCATE